MERERGRGRERERGREGRRVRGREREREGGREGGREGEGEREEREREGGREREMMASTSTSQQSMAKMRNCSSSSMPATKRPKSHNRTLKRVTREKNMARRELRAGMSVLSGR